MGNHFKKKEAHFGERTNLTHKSRTRSASSVTFFSPKQNGGPRNMKIGRKKKTLFLSNFLELNPFKLIYLYTEVTITVEVGRTN